jgi:hypothetical protein
VSVTYGNVPLRFTASKKVLVIPAGTYAVSGFVREESFPVAEATVTVMSATTGAGLETVTHSDGFYELFGVEGQAQIRFSKSGYSARVETLAVTAHSELDTQLVPEHGRGNYSGTYQLTVTAGNCRPTSYGSNVLPVEARARSYSARLTQNGPDIRVELNGAGLIAGAFSGRVEPNQLLFKIGGWVDFYYYGDPFDLVEALAPSSFFVVEGAARVVEEGSTPRLSGELDGAIGVARIASPVDANDFSAQCYAPNHRFVLERR